MQHHEISFQFKANYYKIGEINHDKKQIWFVIHGYGQLAKYFIKKFASLSKHNICVIAPEGLSHFYLQDVQTRAQTGNTRVGASWMTRENRLQDIDNYLRYLQTVYENEIPKNHFNIPVTVLGFSQGAATASRWVADGKINFNRFILWAGILPPDINFESGKDILQNKETYLVYGKNDPFLKDERFSEMDSISEKLNIKPEVVTFEGAHDIDEQTLLRFV